MRGEAGNEVHAVLPVKASHKRTIPVLIFSLTSKSSHLSSNIHQSVIIQILILFDSNIQRWAQHVRAIWAAVEGAGGCLLHSIACNYSTCVWQAAWCPYAPWSSSAVSQFHSGSRKWTENTFSMKGASFFNFVFQTVRLYPLSLRCLAFLLVTLWIFRPILVWWDYIMMVGGGG